MNHILAFFASIGHLVGRALGLVKELVPEDTLLRAVVLAGQAAGDFLDTADRREWVVATLMAELHLPESVARLATELAVSTLKHQAAAPAESAPVDPTPAAPAA